MQTFLPYPDFRESLESLDYKRLGKQRVESLQLIKSIYIEDYGWRNHPCSRMWRDYPNALIEYMNISIDVWVERGYNNTMQKQRVDNIIYPKWLGDNKFHDSHKANLLSKDYDFYSRYNWNVDKRLPYYWNGYGKGE